MRVVCGVWCVVCGVCTLCARISREHTLELSLYSHSLFHAGAGGGCAPIPCHGTAGMLSCISSSSGLYLLLLLPRPPPSPPPPPPDAPPLDDARAPTARQAITCGVWPRCIAPCAAGQAEHRMGGGEEEELYLRLETRGKAASARDFCFSFCRTCYSHAHGDDAPWANMLQTLNRYKK